MASESRPPFPPFTEETATKKVKAAQDAWNSKCVLQYPLRRLWPNTRPSTDRPSGRGQIDSLKRRNPASVKMAYTPDSIWRNRGEFLQGRDAIEKFLTDKWSVENGYRLRKELFAFKDDRIAVQFWYEWHDASGQWWRSYGLEDWTFAENGLMRKRQNSTNDVKISEDERWFKDGVDVNTVEISEKHW